MKNQKIKIRKVKAIIIPYFYDPDLIYGSDLFPELIKKTIFNKGKKFWDIRPPEQVNNYIRIKKMAEEINRIQYRVYMSDEAILKLYE